MKTKEVDLGKFGLHLSGFETEGMTKLPGLVLMVDGEQLVVTSQEAINEFKKHLMKFYDSKAPKEKT